MESEKLFDISVIIVNYKTPVLLSDCIRSIVSTKNDIKVEIIVVDNFSQDNSEEMARIQFADLVWIDMGYNAGFGRANNAGIRISKGEYILLLNSDTLLTESCLEKTLASYRKLENNQNTGLLACKMLDMNGDLLFNSNLHFHGIRSILSENYLVRRFSPGAKRRRFNKNVLLHNHDHESRWIGAAFVFCKSSIFFSKNIYFDESFFMYFEDVEWCYRIRKNGLKNYYITDTFMYHINCGSSGHDEWKAKQMLLSEMVYLKKTRGNIYFTLSVIIQLINIFLERFFLFKVLLINRKRHTGLLRNLIMKRRLITSYYCKILEANRRNENDSEMFIYKRLTSNPI